MKKIWKIVRWNKRYEVSNYGEVRFIKNKRLQKFHTLKNGSKLAYLSFKNGTKKNIMVHKLVFTHFKKEQIIRYKHLIMHNDFNRSNNKTPNLSKHTHGDVLRMWYEHKNRIRGVYTHSSTVIKKDGTKKTYNRYRAVLKYNKKTKTLGYFDTKREAASAYYSGYQELYGRPPFRMEQGL
ncbi:MAG: hypothetical protein HC836_45275 [Richelia sp. RM2_1_2]|nr:hypothetical protein [Richelia sp. RM2_1_2]